MGQALQPSTFIPRDFIVDNVVNNVERVPWAGKDQAASLAGSFDTEINTNSYFGEIAIALMPALPSPVLPASTTIAASAHSIPIA